MEKCNMYINGQWESGEKHFLNISPQTQQCFAKVAECTDTLLEHALNSAKCAQTQWKRLTHTARSQLFLEIASKIEQKKEQIVEALIEESGSTYGKALFETTYTAGIFKAAAALSYNPLGEIYPSIHNKFSMAIRQPVGVVSVITPWNFPFLLSSRGISTAIVLGNTVILKPSEETPYCGGQLLAELFHEVGVPRGVLNVITCSRTQVESIGKKLTTDKRINAISFTGSSKIGKQIASQGGENLKKTVIEAGGKDPLLVLPDADLNRAVNAATFGSFMHQGQICMSVEKIILHKSIADQFLRRFVKNVKKLPIGNPAEKHTVIGPLINKNQCLKIHEHVTDACEKGATLLTGGTFEELFYKPTILTNVTPEMKIYHEETFGPVVTIHIAESIEQMISLANDSTFGLSAGIISRNENTAQSIAQQLEVGMVHINDSSLNDEPHTPFGGMKQSGLGRHDGSAGIEAFTETRWITIDRGERNYPPIFNE